MHFRLFHYSTNVHIEDDDFVLYSTFQPPEASVAARGYTRKGTMKQLTSEAGPKDLMVKKINCQNM